MQAHLSSNLSEKSSFKASFALTSSTLNAAALPAAVSPQVQVLRLFMRLTAALLRLVQRHSVLIVDPIRLVMEQENLGGEAEQ